MNPASERPELRKRHSSLDQSRRSRTSTSGTVDDDDPDHSSYLPLRKVGSGYEEVKRVLIQFFCMMHFICHMALLFVVVFGFVAVVGFLLYWMLYGSLAVQYPVGFFSSIVVVAGTWFHYRWQAHSDAQKEANFDGDSLESILHRLKENTKAKIASEGFFTTNDGCSLKYRIVGSGKRNILVCNGVNCSYLLWYPFATFLNSHLFEKKAKKKARRKTKGEGGNKPFGSKSTDEFKQGAPRQMSSEKDITDLEGDYSVIFFDYRGLYESAHPTNRSHTSIHSMTQDVLDLSKHLGIESFHAVFGWSTGVQVALEFAATYPDKLERLVLLNGNYGHSMRCAFQPFWLVRFEVMGYILHTFLFVMRNLTMDPEKFEWFRYTSNIMLNFHRRFVAKPLGVLLKTVAYEWMIILNLSDLFNNGQIHFQHACHILQVLDGHSCFHLLPDIETPTLLVCGLMDAMTPAYQMYEMVSLMPNARLKSFMFGTHHALIELPDQCSEQVTDFLVSRPEEYMYKNKLVKLL